MSLDSNLLEVDDSFINKHGQWIRRRLLDGSLNRVPIGFYSKIWVALEKVIFKRVKTVLFLHYNFENLIVILVPRNTN